jgi:tRNA(adenine34) deaminase
VGAVVVQAGQIIGTGQNAPIQTHDPSAHAEMVALRQAAQHLGNYRLEGCELFVTLEPCAMCAGAMLHARLKRVVFGASDPKTGVAGSVLNLFAQSQLNHQTQVQGGLLAAACGLLLQQFFRQQRAQKALTTCLIRDDALRTPDACFDDLPDMPGKSTYMTELSVLQGLRLHYVDAGPADAATVYLCLHSADGWSPQWHSFLSRHAGQGDRVLAVDLIGFGKSDKLKKASCRSLEWHARIIGELIQHLDLHRLVLVEPIEGSLLDPVTGETLTNLITNVAGSGIVQRQSTPVDSLSPLVLDAPFPDAGHRAAWRVFMPKSKP